MLDLDSSTDDKKEGKSSDSDVDVVIEDGDDDKKVDEKQEVELVDLSMNANLVSPNTSRKKKLNKGAAVF